MKFRSSAIEILRGACSLTSRSLGVPSQLQASPHWLCLQLLPHPFLASTCQGSCVGYSLPSSSLSCFPAAVMGTSVTSSPQAICLEGGVQPALSSFIFDLFPCPESPISSNSFVSSPWCSGFVELSSCSYKLLLCSQGLPPGLTLAGGHSLLFISML